MACAGCAEKASKLAAQAKGPPGTIRFTAKKGAPLKAASRVRDMRRRLCSMCREFVYDEEGHPTLEKLYAPYKGKYYCGDPNEPRTDTDEKRFGCGCNVDERVKWETAVCPRGRWGPGKRVSANVIAYFDKPAGAVQQDLYDFIGPARCGRDGTLDCTGIGDVMVQGTAAQAVFHQKARNGMRVRFVAVAGRERWAQLSTGGLMEVVKFEDPHRSRALYAIHSAPIKAVEIDATCRLRGICRQELIALEHTTPQEDTRKWKVEIPDAAMKKADEFLRHPKREQRPIIAFSPWTNAIVRQWPIRHWGHLSELCKAEGFAICLLDAPRPKGKTVPSDAFPYPKFRSNNPWEVAAVISKVDLVIGNDSGMPHVAGFVGTQALAICGPTVGDVAFGGWPTVHPIQSPSKCSGCLWFKDGGWKPWCSFGCQALNELLPETVFERVVATMNAEFVKGMA